jgi:hypothetical protein
MFSRIRKRFTYANVTATLALFFAMTGGALAASHYLITSTKQIKPSVLSALKGKAGPAGASGANGAAGEKGPQGSAGTNGTNGTAGESVSSATLKSGEGGCAAGGSKFTVGGKETSACNGINGKNGVNGMAGFTESLPAGKTETGAWSYSNTNEGLVFTSISFNIPLAKALDAEHVHYVLPNGDETVYGTTVTVETMPSTACKGSAEEPSAEAGNLCIYETDATGVQIDQMGTVEFPPEIFPPNFFPKSFGGENGAGKNGAELLFHTIKAVEARNGFGSWAMTAPES